MTEVGQRAIVAVPVKDEAERISACVRALAGQQGARLQRIVLLVNNTSDGTVAVAQAAGQAFETPIEIIEHWFAPGEASAGSARRMGMERAAACLGGEGVLLTTDADAVPGPDWLAANLYHLRHGVDAVAGRAVLVPADSARIPPALRAADALECAYAAALDEIAALIDPQPWDPWPRHTEHSGASIAVSVAAYRRAGGMPAVPLAEDRQFFAALRRVDAKVRHAPEIAVEVSGRIVGRAEGGMADTIRRRMSAADPYLDSALEPAVDHATRVWLRRCFTLAYAGAPEAEELDETLSAGLGLSGGCIASACRAPFCGAGWERLEQASARLRRRLVPAAQAGQQLAVATRLLDGLRAVPKPQRFALHG